MFSQVSVCPQGLEGGYLSPQGGYLLPVVDTHQPLGVGTHPLCGYSPHPWGGYSPVAR